MTDVEHLPALWATALMAPLHAPGCGCCGGSGGIVLDARSLEEDLLDFLEARHGVGDAAGVIAAKKCCPGDFVAWLLSLESHCLTPEVAQAIVADCASVLVSISGKD